MSDETTVELVAFPGLFDETGERVLIQKVAEMKTFNPELHEKILVSDFADKAMFKRWEKDFGKVPHPNLIDPETGKGRKFKSAEELEGYNPKIHKSIKRADFEDEAVFLEYQADALEARAAILRQQAEETRKLGSVAQRVRAKKLLAFQTQIEKITSELEGEGCDIEALLAATEELDS